MAYSCEGFYCYFEAMAVTALAGVALMAVVLFALRVQAWLDEQDKRERIPQYRADQVLCDVKKHFSTVKNPDPDRIWSEIIDYLLALPLSSEIMREIEVKSKQIDDCTGVTYLTSGSNKVLIMLYQGPFGKASSYGYEFEERLETDYRRRRQDEERAELMRKLDSATLS